MEVSIRGLLLFLAVCVYTNCHDVHVSGVLALASEGQRQTSTPSVFFRPGQPSDQWEMTRQMALNLQNPFSAQGISSNFAVAATENEAKERIVGWVQLTPLGYDLRSSERYDARPGSFDLEEELDNQMLDEFVEDDSIQVPTGWASLPWTKEYRAMETAVQARQERREALLIRQAQEERQNRVAIWELKSLYVQPSFRETGIARGLIGELRKEYESTGKDWSNVYLKTSNPKFFLDLDCFTKIQTRTDVPLALSFPDNASCLRGIS